MCLRTDKQTSDNNKTTKSLFSSSDNFKKSQEDLISVSEKILYYHDPKVIKESAAMQSSTVVTKIGEVRCDDFAELKQPKQYEFMDTLAKITSWQKKQLDYVYKKFDEFHNSDFYKVLSRTTQPAHVITVVIVTTLASMLYTLSISNQSTISELVIQSKFYDKSNNNQKTDVHNDFNRSCNTCESIMLPNVKRLTSDNYSKPPSQLATIIYLLALAANFGSQFWMTFVSGLSLYFSIPRHAFGSVQKVLFPKYFTVNSILSAITLLAFNHLGHVWNIRKFLQELNLSICFLLELSIRLYLVPPLLQLITAKTNIEEKAGIGNEIGFHDPGPLRHCPHYKKLHQQFRRTHLLVAIGNIITLACTALHLQYLSYHLVSLSDCQ